MDLPIDLQNIIISFIPLSEFRPVCKSINREIKNIQKRSVKTISEWWYTKKLHKGRHKNFDNIRNMVRWYVVRYEYLIEHPEFTVRKLELNQDLLSSLPRKDIRKKSHVRDWMLNMPIGIPGWRYVGW